MKKNKLLLIIFCCISFLFVCSGCSKKYSDEAGVYELVSMEGAITADQYEYFTITLYENGKCVVKSQAKGADSAYEANSRFSIKENKIIIVTNNLYQKITETYDYIDGQIIMNEVEISDVGTITAVFERKNNQE
jgi:hypothetical protein